MEGPYTIVIRFAGKEIPKSPFTVGVKGMAGDPTKVTASGPGLESQGTSGSPDNSGKARTHVPKNAGGRQ
jgi:hypothetical protein